MSDDPRTLEYQPAIDGVRAVAVTLVVLFHLGLTWMPAGYLGVSVFFTLSGYLITSLLLAEFGRTGDVSFRRFYARRARRLLPASLLVLLAIVVARWVGEFALVPGLRADLLGALLEVFNWVQLAGTTSYGALFGRAAVFTSPLEHYWSLAIEEQFYLVWPITMLAVMRWSARRGRSAMRPVLALTLAFAVLAPLIGLLWGPDAAYWATPARLPELLVGATAAVWLRRRESTRGPSAAPSWWRWLVPVSLVVIVACSATFPAGAGPAFTGWLAPFALVTAALVLGLQVAGPFRHLLSVRPLVWVGKVSYGLYLVHWPVFVLLRQHGWDTASLGGALVAVAITLAITAASYRFLERPVRSARWTPARTARVAAMASVLTLIGVVAVPVPRGFLEADQAALDAAAADTGVPTETLARVTTTVPATTAVATTTLPGTTLPATTTTVGEVVLPLPPAPNRPVRILTVGDSTSFYVGQALAKWAVANPREATSDLLWCQGCGFILDGTITSFAGQPFIETSNRVLHEDVPKFIDRSHPDVVVLMSTVDDVADRKWNDAEGTLTPRDALFRVRMKEQYSDITRRLLAQGVGTVVWVVPPVPHTRFQSADLGESDRYLIQHEVIGEVVAAASATGAHVVACDMASWFHDAGHDRDDRWRPDGTHMTEESAGWLVDRWLGPWLINTALGG